MQSRLVNHVNRVTYLTCAELLWPLCLRFIGSVDHFDISMSVQYIDLLFVKSTALCFAFLLTLCVFVFFYTVGGGV